MIEIWEKGRLREIMDTTRIRIKRTETPERTLTGLTERSLEWPSAVSLTGESSRHGSRPSRI